MEAFCGYKEMFQSELLPQSNGWLRKKSLAGTMNLVGRLVCVVLACGLLASAAEPASVPPVAVKFLGLFQQLRDAQESQAHHHPQRVSFHLQDTEINDYLRYALHATPRPGIESVTVKIFPQNYISTYTIVDFDAVERWKPGTIPTLLRPVLHGKKSIWVDYRFQASRGTGTFSIEKAYYDKIRLPGFFVSKVIEIVAARQPEKYDTSKPLPLPFGLRELSTAEHVIAGEN